MPDIDASVIPDVQFSGASETDGLRLFGSANDDEFPVDFQRASEHALFCEALDEIATRPQPTDDFEQIVVGDQYLIALVSIGPEAIRADMRQLQAWTTSIVEAGEFTDELEIEFLESDIGDAVDRIDDFVDTNCNGL